MMDLLFNIAMCLFGALCLWIAFDDRIHTGLLGALGFAAAAVQAARIMDDSVLRSVDGTQDAVFILVVSLMAAIGNVLYSMWKAGVFGLAMSMVPRRRRTDFGELDAIYSDAAREERRLT